MWWYRGSSPGSHGAGCGYPVWRAHFQRDMKCSRLTAGSLLSSQRSSSVAQQTVASPSFADSFLCSYLQVLFVSCLGKRRRHPSTAAANFKGFQSPSLSSSHISLIIITVNIAVKLNTHYRPCIGVSALPAPSFLILITIYRLSAVKKLGFRHLCTRLGSQSK